MGLKKYFSAFFLLLLGLNFAARAAKAEDDPLYLILLLDSSGSMRQTDPHEYRKLAAETVLYFLSGKDRVEVMEFSEEGKRLSGWVSAEDKSKLIRAIQKIGNSGRFTDFKAGLEEALKAFRGVPSSARKTILLLSDGLFEPNPYDDEYAPYYLEFRKETLGKNRWETYRIYEQRYREKLKLVSERIVRERILTELKKKHIEVFTVGLSPQADKNFLRELSVETSLNPTEVHFFHAETAVELMPVFLGLLDYWKGVSILKNIKEAISPEKKNEIFLDSFLRDVKIIEVHENQGVDFFVEDEEGREATVLSLHPNLNVAVFDNAKIPSKWHYGFRSGRGLYHLIIVGKSTITLDVKGLKPHYVYGEWVKAKVFLRAYGRNGMEAISKDSRMEAEVYAYGKKEIVPLSSQGGYFYFKYLPPGPGRIKIKFVLIGRDLQGNELFPRPSKVFFFTVMPSFYVLPSRIDFSEIKRGESGVAYATLYSGLSQDVEVNVQTQILQASRCKDLSKGAPYLLKKSYPLPKGSSKKISLTLASPKGGCWGDFEGKLIFSTSNGYSYSILFSVHVKSIWEKLTYWGISFVIFSLVLLIGLVIIWGNMGKPRGMLLVTKAPGVLKEYDRINLSKWKRGFLTRVFNWRANKISIGGGRCDIKLSKVNPELRMEFVFYKFGGAYVRNASAKDSGLLIEIESEGIQYHLRPGRAYVLRDGLRIRLDGYEFVYRK